MCNKVVDKDVLKKALKIRKKVLHFLLGETETSL